MAHQSPLTGSDIEKMRKDPKSLLSRLEKFEEILKEEHEKDLSYLFYYAEQKKLKEKLDEVVNLLKSAEEKNREIQKQYQAYVDKVKKEQQNNQQMDDTSFTRLMNNLLELQKKFYERMKESLARFEVKLIEWEAFKEKQTNEIAEKLSTKQTIMLDGKEFAYSLHEDSLSALRSKSEISNKMLEIFRTFDVSDRDDQKFIVKAHTLGARSHVLSVLRDDLRKHHSHRVAEKHVDNVAMQIYNHCGLDQFLAEGQHQAEKLVQGLHSAAKEVADTAKGYVKDVSDLLGETKELLINKPINFLGDVKDELANQFGNLISAINPFSHEKEHSTRFRM